MKMMQRVLAMLLSVAMMAAPTLSFAEDEWRIPAGEITTTAISDDYVGGEQINLSAALKADLQGIAVPAALALGKEEQALAAKLEAVQALIEKCTVEMSFYDDFGTARIHGDLLCDGVSVISGTAMIFEDGSVQLMTSLTGPLVLTMPVGTVTEPEAFDVFSLMYGEYGQDKDYEGAFEDLPASDRLSIAGTDLVIMVFRHLLGWVSATQMETGELYVFDDTYLEPTETRDGVAQRMIGTIKTEDFIHLLWNVVYTIRDDYGLFQQALADVLAENGVTRTQVRKVADTLLTKEVMDPAVDWVQSSASIPDDGALCRMDDIQYFFKKLAKSVDGLWHETVPGNMSMIVSYDDYGEMVGFDAVVPKITESWPFEGDFEYSIKTDDNWQRLHKSHGELQVYGNNRVVGDLGIQFGEDVDGKNVSYFAGQLDVVNQDDQSSVGFGTYNSMTFTANEDEAGNQGEIFDLGAALHARVNGEDVPLVSAALTGETKTGDEGFAITANAVFDASLASLSADLIVARAEYEEIEFTGGEAIDLTALDEAQVEKIKNQVVNNAASMALSLAMRPAVMSSLMKLVE